MDSMDFTCPLSTHIFSRVNSSVKITYCQAYTKWIIKRKKIDEINVKKKYKNDNDFETCEKNE